MLQITVDLESAEDICSACHSNRAVCFLRLVSCFFDRIAFEDIEGCLLRTNETEEKEVSSEDKTPPDIYDVPLQLSFKSRRKMVSTVEKVLHQQPSGRGDKPSTAYNCYPSLPPI